MTEFGLAADVPRVKLNVLVLEGLNVEADRWDRVDDLIELHLVEDCRFTCGVEAEHQQTCFFFASGECVPKISEKVSHFIAICLVVSFLLIIF